MPTRRKNCYTTQDEAVEAYQSLFLDIVHFKAHGHSSTENKSSSSPHKKRYRHGETTTDNYTEKHDQLEKIAEEFIDYIDQKKTHLSFEDDSEREKFKSVFVTGFKDYQKDPKELFKTFDEKDEKYWSNIENSELGSYNNNFYAILLMAKVAEFSDAFRVLINGETIEHDYEDTHYFFPSVFFRIQMNDCADKNEGFKFTNANKFYHHSMLWDQVQNTSGLNLNIYRALEDESSKTHRQVLRAIEQIYKGNQQHIYAIKADDFQLLRSLNNFLNKKHELTYGHHQETFTKTVARFSINYMPEKEQVVNTKLDLSILTKHFCENIPLQSCNPYFVQIWLKEFNKLFKQQHHKLVYDIKHQYWLNIKVKFYISLLIALVTTLLFVGILMQIYAPLILLDTLMTLGFASFVYSQFIAGTNFHCEDLNLTFKISSTNIFKVLNFWLTLALASTWLVCFIAGISLQTTLPLLFNIMGLAGLFSVYSNKHVFNCLLQDDSIKIAEKCFRKEVNNLTQDQQSSPKHGDHNLYSLFRYDPINQAIVIKEHRNHIGTDLNTSLFNEKLTLKEELSCL